MVAFPAIIKTAQEKFACKPGASLLHGGAPDDHMFYLSHSWPWELQEELQHPNSFNSTSIDHVAALPHECVDTLSHCYKQQRSYSLSSRPEYSATASTSRSAISSFTSATSASPTSIPSHSHATSSPAASHPIQQFTSLWDDEDEDPSEKDTAKQQLPPIDPCDHMKTLLTQLASCVSSITTAYAHQQAAIHSHSVQAGAAGVDDRIAMAVTSVTDKAMVEALESLSRLHSQLALLPSRLPFKEIGADIKENSTIATMLQLRRYEGIITQFHDEIWRKNAVVEALKETLAKSMLKGEKLQQRVKVLEAKLTHSPVENANFS